MAILLSKKQRERFGFNKVYGAYTEAQTERSEWEAEWRQISNYLLPGRGIYQTYSKPRKRKLTTDNVINTVAEDALYVLTSGMHGALTSPSRPWFKLSWADKALHEIDPVVMWLQQSEKIVHECLQASNFYSVINSFYIEYAGFGTGSVYVGEDTGNPLIPFRFELLTAGEYAFAVGADGKIAAYYRTIFMTPRKFVERFPETASQPMKDLVSSNDTSIDRTYITVLEYITKEPYQDKDYIRMFFEVQTAKAHQANSPSSSSGAQTPLEVTGFYEHPYPTARWGTIGSDEYGIGPGSRALPDIKRLQEMEKSFLMATHKAINPPLNIPSRMRGKVNTLPGGRNYYGNPQEVITAIESVRFDYQGVGGAIERVEQRIQRNFFNDIFLTGSRDPNATPYKATEVTAREQEKMLRLGPVIERLQNEFLQPLIERCFNICLRKGMLPPPPEEFVEMMGDYQISLVSPLATAQRGVALQGINSFLGFVGQLAQFKQEALDRINVDGTIDEYADITGVQMGEVLVPIEDAQMVRSQRAQAQAQEKQMAEQAAVEQHGSEMRSQDASTRKEAAEANLAMLEGQQLQDEMGMM